MFHTKCGCPFCKEGKELHTRRQWKSRKNKKGRTYGLHTKPRKAHSQAH